MHSGRHFGQVIFSFYNVRSLILNGLARLADSPGLTSLSLKYLASFVAADEPVSHPFFTSREQQEDRIFHELLKLCHGPDERLTDAEPEELQLIGDLVSVFLHMLVHISC
jgi:hypothetical protein